MNPITGKILYYEIAKLKSEMRQIEGDEYEDKNYKESLLEELNGFLKDLNEDIQKLKDFK